MPRHGWPRFVVAEKHCHGETVVLHEQDVGVSQQRVEAIGRLQWGAVDR